MNPLILRLMDKVLIGDDCWEWIASKDRGGYGMLGFPPGKVKRAHRVLYEMLVGPIPEGCDLHHSCHNRACVNPKHLSPQPHGEHIREHRTGLRMERCRRGHPMDGRRQCRKCQTDLARERRASRRKAA